jgi:CRP/FNR family cyclic AMP-dependent transcriptional regulator
MSVALHKNPEFSRLSIDCLAKLYGMGTPCDYPKGALIVQQGAAADGAYIMQSGVAKVSLSNGDGKAAILNVLRAGDMFGEIAILDGGPRMASVVAMDAVQLLKVSKEDFLSLLAQHPEFALCLAQYVCRRVRHADRKIGEMAVPDLQERVSRQLHELAIVDKAGKLIVPDAVTHQDIAEMVGTSREKVSQALRALLQAGKLSMRDTTLVLRATSTARAPRLSACA